MALIDLPGHHHDLVGSLAATALATHAIGQYRQHAARRARVRNDLDLVLLVRPIASVHPGGGVEAIGESGSGHDTNIRDRRRRTTMGDRELLPLTYTVCVTMDDNLHSPQRRLIELRMEHADLDSLIDRLADEHPLDDLVLRRLKKRRLLLRDQIAHLAAQVDPPEPA